MNDKNIRIFTAITSDEQYFLNEKAVSNTTIYNRLFNKLSD